MSEPLRIDELYAIVGTYCACERVLSIPASDVAGGTGQAYLMPCVGDRGRVEQLWRDTRSMRETMCETNPGLALRVIRLSQRTDVTEEFNAEGP